MVAFTRSTLEFLTFALTPIRDAREFLNEQIERSDNDGWRGENHRESLRGMAALIWEDWRDGEGIPDISLATIREQLAQELRLTDPDREDDDWPDDVNAGGESLVELVAEVLQEPLARQMLSASTIERLRRAILDPEEVARLRQNQERTLACVNCGQLMQQREMITWSNSAAGQTALYCTRCVAPQTVRCGIHGCNEPAPVARINARCPAHSAESRAGGASGSSLLDDVPSLREAMFGGVNTVSRVTEAPRERSRR